MISLSSDDMVIVDPSTYKIVDVLPLGPSDRDCPSTGTVFAQDDFFRQGSGDHPQTCSFFPGRAADHGSSTTTQFRVGERLPESVEIRSFPETVYRESPSLRDYRYIERENRTYVIEPRERTIIEEID